MKPKINELIREQINISKSLDEFLMQNMDKMSLSGRKRVDLYASAAGVHLGLLNKEKEKVDNDGSKT